MMWTLHRQPKDLIADHEYSIWLNGEIVILANTATDQDAEVLERIVHLLNSNSAIKTADRGQGE